MIKISSTDQEKTTKTLYISKSLKSRITKLGVKHNRDANKEILAAIEHWLLQHKDSPLD